MVILSSRFIYKAPLISTWSTWNNVPLNSLSWAKATPAIHHHGSELVTTGAPDLWCTVPSAGHIKDQRQSTHGCRVDPLGTSLSIPVIVVSCAYPQILSRVSLSSLWRLNMYKFNTIVIKVSSPWSNVVFCVDIQGRQQKPETLTLTILMLLDIKILEDNRRLNRQHQFIIKYRIKRLFYQCISLLLLEESL